MWTRPVYLHSTLGEYATLGSEVKRVPSCALHVNWLFLSLNVRLVMISRDAVGLYLSLAVITSPSSAHVYMSSSVWSTGFVVDTAPVQEIVWLEPNIGGFIFDIDGLVGFPKILYKK
jgi:hypothetical protein